MKKQSTQISNTNIKKTSMNLVRIINYIYMIDLKITFGILYAEPKAAKSDFIF